MNCYTFCALRGVICLRVSFVCVCLCYTARLWNQWFHRNAKIFSNFVQWPIRSGISGNS